MADCNIRNIDPILLRKLKVCAAEQGITLRDFAIKALTFSMIEHIGEVIKKHNPMPSASDPGYRKSDHAETCKCFICKPPKEK